MLPIQGFIMLYRVFEQVWSNVYENHDLFRALKTLNTTTWQYFFCRHRSSFTRKRYFLITATFEYRIKIDLFLDSENNVLSKYSVCFFFQRIPLNNKDGIYFCKCSYFRRLCPTDSYKSPNFRIAAIGFPQLIYGVPANPHCMIWMKF